MYNQTMDKFWNKVDKTDSCWLWTGAKSSSGYGHLNINKKTIKAHRFSYEYYVGPLDHKLMICHNCNNTKCVNPNHLRQDTQKSNIIDMVKIKINTYKLDNMDMAFEIYKLGKFICHINITYNSYTALPKITLTDQQLEYIVKSIHTSLINNNTQQAK